MLNKLKDKLRKHPRLAKGMRVFVAGLNVIYVFISSILKILIEVVTIRRNNIEFPEVPDISDPYIYDEDGIPYENRNHKKFKHLDDPLHGISNKKIIHTQNH